MFFNKNVIDSNEEWSNYRRFVSNDVIQCKDGTFLAMFKVSASDWQSASPSERSNQRVAFANAVKKMGTGWALHSSVCVSDSSSYTAPGETYFPNYIGYVIDNRSRKKYSPATDDADRDKPFEEDLYYTVGFTNSTFSKENIKKLLFTVNDAHFDNKLGEALKVYESGLESIVDALSRSSLHFRRLGMIVDESEDGEFIVKSEMIGFLRGLLYGNFEPVIIYDPAAAPDLSKFILSEPIDIGTAESIIGDELSQVRHRVVQIEGFPFAIEKQAMRVIQNLAIPLVWTSRFNALDSGDAKKVLAAYGGSFAMSQVNPVKRAISKEWAEASRGAADVDGERFFTKDLVKGIDTGSSAFGFYTSVILLTGKSQSEVDERAAMVKKSLENVGIIATIEEIISIEGIMASLPGNHYHLREQQVSQVGTEDAVKPMYDRYRQRQHLGTNIHAASLFPSSGIWSGEKYHPSDQYPHQSPPLLYLDTLGNRPHRLTTFVEDLGHAFCLGQTGSGKSTVLNQMCVAQLKYKDGLVIVLDKKKSFYTSCALMGGEYYEMGNSSGSNAHKFSPLARIEDPVEREWLVTWFEMIAQIAGVNVTASISNKIRAMVEDANRNGHKNLTAMLTTARIPSELAEVFVKYTAGSSMLGDLFDGDGTEIQSDKRMLCFAMDAFFSKAAMSSEVVPLAYFIFHFFQQLLDGRPGMVVIDEGHNLLREPENKDFRVTFDFGSELEKFLLELRSLNGFLLFATQNIAAIANSSISIKTALTQSTATKIYLADKSAEDTVQAELYRSVGLSDFEIRMIAQANMRRDILTIKKTQNDSSEKNSEPRRRLSTNTLDAFTLNCVGVTDKKVVEKTVMRLIDQHGVDPFNWHSHFCVERGLFSNIEEYKVYVEGNLKEMTRADKDFGYNRNWVDFFSLGN